MIDSKYEYSYSTFDFDNALYHITPENLESFKVAKTKRQRVLFSHTVMYKGRYVKNSIDPKLNHKKTQKMFWKAVGT